MEDPVDHLALSCYPCFPIPKGWKSIPIPKLIHIWSFIGAGSSDQSDWSHEEQAKMSASLSITGPYSVGKDPLK